MMQRVHGDTEGEQNNATITYYIYVAIHCVTNLGFVAKAGFINLDNVGMDGASSSQG